MDEQTPLDEARALRRLIDEVRRLVLEVGASDVTEFELAYGPLQVRLEQLPGVPRPTEAAVEPEAAGLVRVVSPLTGVYYARPNPTAPPFVEVGDVVEPEQVLCLVEAMKAFNEIRSEVAGRVRQVVAQNGQLVQAGDTLMLIEPAEPGGGSTEAGAGPAL